MAIIGFVLLAAAAVFGVEIVAMNDISVDVEAFNQIYTSSVAVLFVAGVITGLAGALGVMLIRDGLVRRRRLHAEARDVEVERQRHIAALEEEHDAHHRADTHARKGEPVDLREDDRVVTF